MRQLGRLENAAVHEKSAQARAPLVRLYRQLRAARVSFEIWLLKFLCARTVTAVTTVVEIPCAFMRVGEHR